jgi:hypothetical protein
MKPDKLEKFILDHQQEFDFHEPDPGLWDKINPQKPVVRKIVNWNSIAWKVAAGIIIFVASYFFHDFMADDKQDNFAQNNPQQQDYDMVEFEQMETLMEAEVYYSSQIKSAKTEIEKLTNNDAFIMKDVQYDLIELDDVFKALKNDLNENSGNEEVVEAMIQNYRLRLQILNDILLQLNKAKKTQDDDTEENKI